VDDLQEPFRSKTTAFLGALADAGARVTIAATLRPPQRAYLMHYSSLIARNNLDPVSAAQKMVAGYEIESGPALTRKGTRSIWTLRGAGV
jgi:hypothetical protein